MNAESRERFEKTVQATPGKNVDVIRINALRSQGIGWKRIAAELGVVVGTALRLAKSGSQIQEKVFGTQ